MKNILACDIGYGKTKIVFGQDADSDSWSEMCFKSAAPNALVQHFQSKGILQDSP